MEAWHQQLPESENSVVITSQPYEIPDFPKISAYMLKPAKPTAGLPSLLRHPIATIAGAGILTCFPSATPFGLALGADSPCVDERCTGTLSLSARGILTPFIVTYVSILSSDTSNTHRHVSSTAYRMLLYRS